MWVFLHSECFKQLFRRPFLGSLFHAGRKCSKYHPGKSFDKTFWKSRWSVGDELEFGIRDFLDMQHGPGSRSWLASMECHNFSKTTRGLLNFFKARVSVDLHWYDDPSKVMGIFEHDLFSGSVYFQEPIDKWVMLF